MNSFIEYLIQNGYVPIEGRERYYINEYGEVINSDTARKLAPCMTNNRFFVTLYGKKGEGSIKRPVAELVYQHFADDYEEGYFYKNIDGNPYNNHIDNIVKSKSARKISRCC